MSDYFVPSTISAEAIVVFLLFIEASHISVEGLGGVYAASFTGSQGSGTL